MKKIKDDSQMDPTVYKIKLFWEKHGETVQNIITWIFGLVGLYILYLHQTDQLYQIVYKEVCAGILMP